MNIYFPFLHTAVLCNFCCSLKSSVILLQKCRTYGAGRDLLGTRHSLLSLFFFNFFCPTSVSTLCVELVHELPLLPNNTEVKHLYTNRKRCQVLNGKLSPERRPVGDWANMWHWTKRFTITTINCWPQCSKDNQMSFPFPVLRWVHTLTLPRTLDAVTLQVTDTIRSYKLNFHPVPHDVNSILRALHIGVPSLLRASGRCLCS